MTDQRQDAAPPATPQRIRLRAALADTLLAYHTFNGRCTTDLPSCQQPICAYGKRVLADEDASAKDDADLMDHAYCWAMHGGEHLPRGCGSYRAMAIAAQLQRLRLSAPTAVPAGAGADPEC